MAFRCSWCGSVLTQPGLDEYTCLACGKQTGADGTKAISMVPAPGNPEVPADHAFLPNLPGPAVTPVASGTQETAEPEVVIPPAAPIPDAPAPIDLNVLSPEQVAAIELIAHPEV